MIYTVYPFNILLMESAYLPYIQVIQGFYDLLYSEEQPSREGAHHQAAEGGAEAGGGQAGAAEEAPTEPDTEGQPAEGKHTHSQPKTRLTGPHDTLSPLAPSPQASCLLSNAPLRFSPSPQACLAPRLPLL